MEKTGNSFELNKLSCVKDGVERFFEEKHERLPEYEITDGKRYKTIAWEGKSAPLFSFFEHPKIVGLTAKRELLGLPCAITAYSVDDATLDTLLFRELVIAEACLSSDVNKVTVFQNENTATAVIKTDNDCAYFVTLHSSSFGGKQFKHEFFNTEGMIANRAVDTVIAQDALNIFTKQGREGVTDNLHVLYGLSPEEVNEVVAIYAAITDGNYLQLNAQAERLNKIVDVAFENLGKCVTKGVDF